MVLRLMRSEVRVAYPGALTAEIEVDSIPGNSTMEQGHVAFSDFRYRIE